MSSQNRRPEANQTNAMQELEWELAEWRRTHGAPLPIPEEVWSRAVVLAQQHGLGIVARTLRLNYAHLKRRMETSSTSEQAATFIELLSSSAPSIEKCAVEIESERGTRMRVVMKSVPSGWLAGVLREFAR